MTTADFEVKLPQERGLSQDQEYCFVTVDGRTRKIRFHDYDEIYAVPGLYEYLFHGLLQCRSPQLVVSLLVNELLGHGMQPAAQRVLDIGGGSGLVGAELRSAGFPVVWALDRDDWARSAAERDRPGVYDRYLVSDLKSLPEEILLELRTVAFTCFLCVAALGFDDISTEGFERFVEILPVSGWLALSFHEDLATKQTGRFASFIRRLAAEERLNILRRTRYRHRLAMDGRPIYYVSIIGTLKPL